jgi:hypothetical protein
MAGDARDLCNHVVSAGTDVLTDVVNSSLVQNVLQSQVMITNIVLWIRIRSDPELVGLVALREWCIVLFGSNSPFQPQLTQRQFSSSLSFNRSSFFWIRNNLSGSRFLFRNQISDWNMLFELIIVHSILVLAVIKKVFVKCIFI